MLTNQRRNIGENSYGSAGGSETYGVDDSLGRVLGKIRAPCLDLETHRMRTQELPVPYYKLGRMCCRAACCEQGSVATAVVVGCVKNE